MIHSLSLIRLIQYSVLHKLYHWLFHASIKSRTGLEYALPPPPAPGCLGSYFVNNYFCWLGNSLFTVKIWFNVNPMVSKYLLALFPQNAE